MSKFIAGFGNLQNMASECFSSADDYREYIQQMKGILQALRVMDEPSLSNGLTRIEDLVSDMENTADKLDNIGGKLNRNISALKKTQDEITKKSGFLSNNSGR